MAQVGSQTAETTRTHRLSCEPFTHRRDASWATAGAHLRTTLFAFHLSGHQHARMVGIVCAPKATNANADVDVTGRSLLTLELRRSHYDAGRRP